MQPRHLVSDSPERAGSRTDPEVLLEAVRSDDGDDWNELCGDALALPDGMVGVEQFRVFGGFRLARRGVERTRTDGQAPSR